MNKKKQSGKVAVIGMSGRFPGANTVQSFWKNLCKGKDCITRFSDGQLLKSGVSSEQINNENYVKARGIIEGIEYFDSAFFNYNQKEAQATDPQHRIFLECIWEALEDAGCTIDSYIGKVGVYGGTGPSYYYLNNILSNPELVKTTSDFLLRIGNDKDYLTTKASYKLNLTGPSVNIQSACSSSLIAISMATSELLSYQCDMALAGGVSITVPQVSGTIYKDGMIISPDGYCRPFDSQAKGTVLSNGAGVVALKRLEDAVRDRDHIYSVILGYGVSNDGGMKMNFAAPSSTGQVEAIKSALAMSKISPRTVGYVEAHGTGTILGDPIEIDALNTVYSTNEKQFCVLGSVKANVGHCFEASGVIGFIKAVLTTYYGCITPSINFEKPNPHINLSESPFYINNVLCDWEKSNFPRRAGVSAFGIGGTNVHMIIEEWNSSYRDDSNQKVPKEYPISITANSPSALKNVALNLVEYLKENNKISLPDISYTLCTGRKRLKFQKTFFCSNIKDVIRKLEELTVDRTDDASEVDFLKFFKGVTPNKVPLPTYPFEKEKCWVDPYFSKKPISKEINRSQTIDVIRDAWSNFLGHDSFTNTDSFFDVGGDSLLAAEIASYLSSIFDINISMQTFTHASSVQLLASHLLKSKHPKGSIVELKPISKSSPIFLVYPIEGNLLCFRHLCERLSIDRPIYGLQDKFEEQNTIQEIASSHIDAIKKIQPHGPYNLIGASFGGILGYEIASQLHNLGEKIDLLCLLDSFFPEKSFYELPSDQERLSYLFKFLTNKNLDSKLDPMNELLSALGYQSVLKDEEKLLKDQIRKNLRILSSYKPPRYEGDVSIFISDVYHNDVQDLKKLWSKYVTGDLDCQPVSGKHLEILSTHNVGQLVEFIEKKLHKRRNNNAKFD